MNKYNEKILKLKLIYRMCDSLSSIAKYKYVKYLQKISFLEKLLQELTTRSINLQKSSNCNKNCIIVIGAIGYYISFINSAKNYNKVFIICDYNTEKKIKNVKEPKINSFVYSFDNKRIKEFKTNNYEGLILHEYFSVLKRNNTNSIDVYYNNKFIKTYTDLNNYDYDNNNKQTHTYEILFCIYLNSLLLYMCLNESNNLDQALKKIKQQILQIKTQYKNYKSKQHLFNICKFHS